MSAPLEPLAHRSPPGSGSSPRASPAAALRCAWSNRALLADLVRRDFLGRYRGSTLGAAWALFNPLLMAAVYTLVFSVAFKIRWPGVPEGEGAFGVVLFAGIVVHAFFAECITRAPTLVTGQPNFVKKVVFPLEILPWMTVLSALLHLAIGIVVLVALALLAGMSPRAGVVLVPVALLPLALMTLGISWALASLGVYLKDLNQVMGVVVMVLLFLSPVFYPVASLPGPYRFLVALNPISAPVEHVRDLVLWGRSMDWGAWAVQLGIGAAVFQVGFWWFRKTRDGFADAL